MRVRLSRGFLTSRLGLALLGIVSVAVLAAGGVFAHYWTRYGRMIDESLAGEINLTTARIYSAPIRIFTGDEMSVTDLVGQLQRSGYTQYDIEGATGRYAVDGDAVEIRPGEHSYFRGGNALRVEFSPGPRIRRIRSLDDRLTRDSAEIEPVLLTNMFDSSREKRRHVRFADIPPVLVRAVLAAEDKRFFEHPGIDLIRVLGAAWADLRHETVLQGASTLTMQVSRSFFFTRERTWQRKLAETMVSLQLEQRFTKDQIFEMYANEIYLGNRGSFAIHGFGEGARAYFNKDIRRLTTEEAAFLAGIIRAPNRYASADRRPERAEEARDRVLARMVENGYLAPEEVEEAKAAPLRVVPGTALEESTAPHFVDMVRDHLLDRFSEAELLSQSFRAYTTLDPALERAAIEAMSIGLDHVDQLLQRRYERWAAAGQPAQVQAAMVVLDPKTGEIKALVGGRDYGRSQLNRVMARRQPGSVFKPFVYAAAFDDAELGIPPVVTTATTIMDEPTTFLFNEEEYTPSNYGENFHGLVTARQALTLSLNVATVKLAELIGYGRVLNLARQMGLDNDMLATPALALGAYEMTPLEVAAAYTAFADGGVRAEPFFLDRVISSDGITLDRGVSQTRPVLDPRVTYLVTDILEDVINRGTGYSVRARGFLAPAAGKTGTSRDGWFAGFTSNLLCIVWVGFDDNRDLELSGAASAAPIWTEFMKRATSLAAYREVEEFVPPAGLTTAMLDEETYGLATPACPLIVSEIFIAGTEPEEFCPIHGGAMMTGTPPPISWLSGLFGGRNPERPVEPLTSESAPATTPVATSVAAKPAPADVEAAPAPEPEERKGLLRRIFGIFGGNGDDSEQSNSDR